MKRQPKPEHLFCIEMPKDTETQTIKLTVPESFTAPTIFREGEPQVIAQALRLGAYGYQIMKQEGLRLTNEQLSVKVALQTQEKYQKEIDVLEECIEKQKDQVKTLKERLEDEHASRLSLEKRIREEERRNREEILSEKEQRIQALQEQLKALDSSLRDSSKAIAEQFSSFKEQILKTSAGSKKKGDQGEAVFETVLERVFGTVSVGESFDLENVGREGHQGDIRMNWKGHRFMIEVKNYDRNVDGKEVTKFFRDMEEAKDSQIGLMISLNTGITGHCKSGKVDIEVLRDGRLVVFLSHFMQHEDPVLFLTSLKPFFEVFLKTLAATAKPAEAMAEETRAQRQIERFEQQRATILKVLQVHEEQTRKMKNTLMNAKKKHEQSWLDIMAEMRECEHRVKLLLETICEASIDVEEASGAESLDTAIPGYVFRYTDLSMYSEKERKFVMDLTEYFEFSEDYKSTTMAVKEVLTSLKYTEDQINSLRERVFQEDVWPKGKKEVRYMRVNPSKLGSI